MSEKIYRLLEILNRLNNREILTLETLVRELDVTERTIYRYITALRSARFPIDFDEEKRTYRFPEGYSLQKLKISEDEMLPLLLSREIMAKLGGSLSEKLDSVVQKITTQTRHGKTNGPLPFWIEVPEVDFSRISKVYSQINEAIKEDQRIRIEYVDLNRNRTEREVDPYALVFSDGFVLLVGYCHLKKGIRTFALDLIKEIHILDEFFLRNSDFDLKDYFKSSFKIWDGELEKVVVRFDRAISRRLMRRKWHSSQKTKIQKDGDIIMEFELAGTEEIKSWIYTWIPHCEVIKPASLRNQIKEELALAQTLYKK